MSASGLIPEATPLPGSSDCNDFGSEMRRKVDESNDQNSSLLSLPRELLNTILCFLSVYSLTLFALTSREGYVLSKDEAIWRVLFERIPREIAPDGVYNVMKNMPEASYYVRYRSMVWAGKSHLCYKDVLKKRIRDCQSSIPPLKNLCSDFTNVYDMCGETKSSQFYLSIVRCARSGENISIIHQLQLVNSLFNHVRKNYGEKESINLLRSMNHFINFKDLGDLVSTEKSSLPFASWFLSEFFTKYEDRVKEANFDFPEYGLLIHMQSIREDLIKQIKHVYADEIASFLERVKVCDIFDDEGEMNEKDVMIENVLRSEGEEIYP